MRMESFGVGDKCLVLFYRCGHGHFLYFNFVTILENTNFCLNSLQPNEQARFNRIVLLFTALFLFYIFSVCSTIKHGRFSKPSVFGGHPFYLTVYLS
jgi:hypothetical protein